MTSPSTSFPSISGTHYEGSFIELEYSTREGGCSRRVYGPSRLSPVDGLTRFQPGKNDLSIMLRRRTRIESKKSSDGDSSHAISLMPYKRKPGDLLVQVQVMEGKSLAKGDLFSGKPWPLLCIFVNQDKQPRVKTQAAKKTLNPQWNERVELDVEDFRDQTGKEMKLRLEVFNQASNHDSMGEATLNFRDHPDLFNVTSKWCELFLPLNRGNRERGEVHVGVRCELVDDKDGRMFVKSADERQREPQARKETPFIDPTQCTVTGEGLWDGIRVDRQTFFRVMPHNQFGEPYAGKEGEDRWRIELITPSNERIPIKYDVIPKDDAIDLQCSYEPAMPGEHKVSVSINYKQIKGSPFLVFVHPVTDGAKCVAFGDELQESFEHVVDKPMTFHVQARDSSGLDITEGDHEVVVRIMGPVRDENVASTVTDNNDGSYTVCFTPARAGSYVLNVKCDGQIISNSPLSIKVDPCTHASQCLVDGAEDVIAVGQPSSFVIEARDKFGERQKKGGDCFVVKVTEENGHELPGYVADKDNGFYLVTFIPKNAGAHYVLVTLNKEIVFNRTVNVVRRANHASDYWARGEVLSGVSYKSLSENDRVKFEVAPTESTMSIDSADMTIMAVNEEQSDEIIECNIVNNGDGTHSGSFVPTRAGKYRVEVKLDEEPICNSPLTIWLHDGCDVASIQPYGPGIKKAYIETQTTFFIRPHDSLGRPCGDESNLQFDILFTKDAQRILPLGEDAKPEICNVKYVTSAGQYRVDYVPRAIGTFYMHIRCRDRAIAESPFKITVRDHGWSPSAARCRVIQLAPQCITNEPHCFHVRLYNNKGRLMLNGGDQVQCTVERVSGAGQTDQAINANVDDLNNGTYAVQWTPHAIGKYAIRVNVQGEPIAYSPFTVTVMQPQSHSIPKVMEHSFTIEAVDDNGIPLDDEQAEKTPIAVRFLEEKQSEFRSTYNALTCVKYVGDGKYQCRFITTSSGKFDMLLSVDGKPVELAQRHLLEV